MIDLIREERVVREISSQIDHLQRTLKREREELTLADTTLGRVRDAQSILQSLAQAVQERAHERISEVVSSCLSAVFDDPYEFKILFEKKRGKTEASLRFLRGELDVDPLTASGGGMIDVAAFALRVACLILHRPRLSKIIVLDEPFKFVSSQYRENIKTMLEELAEKTGIQTVMVTHIEELEIGKVISL